MAKLVYDKEEELFFAHIRPRPDVALAPESKIDPGESLEEEGEADEAAALETEEEDSEEDPDGEPEEGEGEEDGR